jgi:hypothetical protein
VSQSEMVKILSRLACSHLLRYIKELDKIGHLSAIVALMKGGKL